MSDTPTHSIKDLSIFSQNVYKKYNLISVLLKECQSVSDIIFIQEPTWVTVHYTASLMEKTGTPVWSPLIHPSWILVIPRVLAPGNKPWSHTDLFNRLNICLITLRGLSGPINLMNIYSDSNRRAIRNLNQVQQTIWKLMYMEVISIAPSGSGTQNVTILPIWKLCCMS